MASGSRLSFSADGTGQDADTAEGDESERAGLPGTVRGGQALLTMDEFAAEVGLTPRTIRTYRARNLLQPPIRCGRARYFGDRHLARIRLIRRLQQAGLTLDAVTALLEPDHLLATVMTPDRSLGSTLRTHPDLAAAMLRCGLLGRLPDGSLRLRGTRAVLAAIVLRRPGVTVADALWALVEATMLAAPNAGALLADLTSMLRDRLHGGWGDPESLRDFVSPAVDLAITAAGGLPLPRAEPC